MINPKFTRYRFIVLHGTSYEQEKLIYQFREDFRVQYESARTVCINIVKEKKYFIKSLVGYDESSIKDKMNKILSENELITKELQKLRNIDLKRLPPILSTKNSVIKKKTSNVLPVSVYDILNMDFAGLVLNGQLGIFLGKIQQEKCAIALTGDSGAGKSTFSFQIAKAFLEKDLSIAYFSLEGGITESTKKMIEKFKMDECNIKLFAEGNLKDVRIESSNFDCVIIDSYSKISSKAEDFENLRQDFPNTFFIIIFQKTTDGKIRGGSSIIFNSTAVIDIRIVGKGHRIAFMQKSRYGTENFIYSIRDNDVLKNNRLPVNWKELNV